MAIGVPVAFALMFCGLVLMWFMGIFNTQILAQNMISGADTFTLLAIPFFILAGELMNTGGLSKRIIDFAISCVGHLRGGLGIVAIIAAVILAALSGSAAADSAALAAILIPMMREAGYPVPPLGGPHRLGRRSSRRSSRPRSPSSSSGSPRTSRSPSCSSPGIVPGLLMALTLVVDLAGRRAQATMSPSCRASPRASGSTRPTAPAGRSACP